MPDQERIRDFCDMVDAAEKLTKPTQEENARLHQQIEKILRDRMIERIMIAFIFLVFGIVFSSFIWFAYMSPDTTYQAQEFEGHQQVQSSGTDVVTQGTGIGEASSNP